MNLMKLFNKKYFFQNIKKSTGILAVILGLVPIINFVMMLVFSLQNEYINVITLNDLSAITVICMFIIPVVVSACLFGFVFKKKTVDFVGSMPISRESIFVTNTLGGIIILLLLLIINTLIFTIFALLSPNIILSGGMIVDYLLIWSISYIFVFTATNLAMSLAGNLVTQIVVTALLLFFVQFVYCHITDNFSYYYYENGRITCTNEDCKPENYNCYVVNDKDDCEEEKDSLIYRINIMDNNQKNFTVPYNIVYRMMVNNGEEFNYFSWISIIKMVVLSIAFAIGGFLLFVLRRMEECETSFKSNTRHTIVKLLTMYPLLMVLLDFDNYSGTPVMLVVALTIIFAYFFIYDLITRRSILELDKSLIMLIAAGIVVIVINLGVDSFHENRYIDFSIDDIKEIRLQNDTFKDVYSSDKNVINSVVKYALESDIYLKENNLSNAGFIIKLDNNKEYYLDISLPEVKYKNIIDTLNKDDALVKAYNNFEFDKTFGIKIEEYLVDAKDYKDLIDFIKSEIKDYSVDKILSDYDYNSSGISISLYSYVNHELKELNINITRSKELTKYIARLHNSRVSNLIKRNYNWINLENVYYSDSTNYIQEEYRFLMNQLPSKFVSFIKREAKKTFDGNKESVVLNFNLDGHLLSLYTNNLSEFDEIITSLRAMYKDDEEYKRVMSHYNEDGSVKGYTE